MSKTKFYFIVGLGYFFILSFWLFWNMKGNPFLADKETRFAETKSYLAENITALPAAINLILFNHE